MAYRSLLREGSQISVWVPLGFMIMILSYIILIGIHRLYFHPLSRFPGPFFAKLTDAYSALHSYQGDMHLDIKRCHEKYGKIVRYGPNRLLTLHAPDMQNIYGFGKPFRKARSYKTMIPWEGGETAATAVDKTLHKGLRQIVVSGLSPSTLKQFEPAVLKSLEMYFQRLLEGPPSNEGWSQARNMRVWNQWLSFDQMTDFGFGTRVGLLDSSEHHYILDLLHMHSVKFAIYEQWPSLSDVGIGSCISQLLPIASGAVLRFNSWYQPSMEKAISNICEVGKGILAPIVQGPRTGKPMSSYTREQMLAEGSFITFTASDGNATVMSGVQYYLGHNAGIYRKLGKEIRDKFPQGEWIQWGPELASCEYLRACIDEGLRMLPPAAGVHWRESLQDGVLINDEEIPAGTEVGLSLYGLFRSREVFRDESRYWPERWIKGVLPENELTRAHQAFKPFQTGPRACAGKHVVYMVTSVSLANLLNEYDFKLANVPRSELGGRHIARAQDDGREGAELQFEDHFITTWKEGPHLQFRRRAT